MHDLSLAQERWSHKVDGGRHGDGGARCRDQAVGSCGVLIKDWS